MCAAVRQLSCWNTPTMWSGFARSTATRGSTSAFSYSVPDCWTPSQPAGNGLGFAGVCASTRARARAVCYAGAGANMSAGGGSGGERLHAPRVVDCKEPGAIRLAADDVRRLPGEVDRVPIWIRSTFQRPRRIDDGDVGGGDAICPLDVESSIHPPHRADRLAAPRRSASERCSWLREENCAILIEVDQRVDISSVKSIHQKPVGLFRRIAGRGTSVLEENVAAILTGERCAR